jgi:hypothetical protein
MMRPLTTTVILTLAVLCLAGRAAAQTFTVTGMFEYEDKAWTYGGWSGTDALRPIRQADVTVLNSSTNAVLGTGSTDANGEFIIAASSAGTINVVVRVNADTNISSFKRIRVTTNGGTEYSALSPVFNSHDTNLDLDVGTTSVLKTLSGGDEGNPFNMLDIAVSAFDYITGPLVNDTAIGGTVTMRWPGTGGSFASGTTLTMSADDGYDDAVILHELGHVVQNIYSDSDNPGGSHFFGDSDQDPRLSMGEGFATFFGGSVMIAELNRAALYVDANGSSQTGGVQLRLRLEETTPYTNDSHGAADEVAVACTLFDIVDTEFTKDQNSSTDDDDLDSSALVNGLDPNRAWWDVLEGPINSAVNLTINQAWDGWFSEHGAGGMHTEMQALFTDHSMRFFEDVDEPNDTIDSVAMVSVTGNWTGNRTFYSATGSPPAPGGGDFDWWGADLVAGSNISIQTRYPGNVSDANTQCDTFMDLFDPNGIKAIDDDSTGTGRNAAINNFVVSETGLWKWRIRSTNSTRYYGTYNWRISYNFENLPPNVSSGPSALPTNILDDSTSSLSVAATDPNAGHTLSYSWTPLGGGTIVGSGSSVSFDPPTVVSQTVFDIALVITDNLGAETGPLIVQVTVDPTASPCGSPAQATSGGVGKPGLVGTPVLSAIGLPVVPSAGAFSLRLTNALPNGLAYIVVGLNLISVPLDGGTLYPSFDITAIVPIPATGVLDLPLAFTDPGFCGAPFYVQALILNDPGAAGSFGTSQTNYVEVIGGF